MPDYSKGRIYTIRYKNDESLVYVGSTIQTLSARMSGHRASSKLDKCKNCKIYKAVSGDWDNWYIILHEDFPCERREQLEKREAEVIREIGTLNKKMAVSRPLHYLPHKERKKQYLEQYRKRDEVKRKQSNQYQKRKTDKDISNFCKSSKAV